MTGNWSVTVTGPARSALQEGLPQTIAWAAYTFITVRLPDDPYRLGGALDGPYEGLHAARLGTYRVVYRIDDAACTVHVLSIRPRGDVYGTR